VAVFAIPEADDSCLAVELKAAVVSIAVLQRGALVPAFEGVALIQLEPDSGGAMTTPGCVPEVLLFKLERVGIEQ
jgi:hypothetical protein